MRDVLADICHDVALRVTYNIQICSKCYINRTYIVLFGSVLLPTAQTLRQRQNVYL